MPCLHDNEAREDRRWVSLAHLSDEVIQLALAELQFSIGKPVAVFSHVALVADLRHTTER